jgi:hypothetical protein
MYIELPIISTFPFGHSELVVVQLTDAEERDTETVQPADAGNFIVEAQASQPRERIRLEKKQHGKQLAGYYQESTQR